MRSSRLGRLAAGLLLAATVAACSGGGPGNDPADTVKGAFDTLASARLDSLADDSLARYLCAANKYDISSLLGLAGATGSLPSGFGDLLGSMRVSYENLSVTQTNLSGDTATVRVAGTMRLSFDDAKLKEFVKQMLEAQGRSVDDATLTAGIAALKSQLGNAGAPLDRDMTLKNEGGRWLICE